MAAISHDFSGETLILSVGCLVAWSEPSYMKANQSLKMDDKANVGPLAAAVIGAVIVLVIGLSLTSTVVSFVNSSFASLTGNAAGQSIVNIIPVFYILGLVVASIGIVFVGLRYAGMGGK